MRTTYLTVSVARDKGTALNHGGKLYEGIAFASTAAIRSVEGITVVDTRRVYCGHADIKTPVTRPTETIGDPLAIDGKEAYDFGRAAKALVGVFTFYEDKLLDDSWESIHQIQ